MDQCVISKELLLYTYLSSQFHSITQHLLGGRSGLSKTKSSAQADVHLICAISQVDAYIVGRNLPDYQQSMPLKWVLARP